VLAASLALGGTSYAGPADEATQHYAAGRKLLEAGRFGPAAVELRASFALVASPNSELLLGHAERELGHKVAAIEAYNHVVVEAGRRVQAGEARYQATLEEAGRWAAVLRSALSEIDVTLTRAADGATLAIDGKKLDLPSGGTGPRQVRVFHEPGSAQVTVHSADGRAFEKTLTLAAGHAESVTMDLGLDVKSPANAAPAVGAPTAAPAPAPASEGGFHGPPLPSWVALGVGVVGAGMFGVFGSMASSKASALKVCAPSCPADRRPEADAGKRDQTLANVGLVIGGVGIATAAVLWIALPAGQSKTALGISPTGATLRGAF
jgi:hypothetical protein